MRNTKKHRSEEAVAWFVAMRGGVMSIDKRAEFDTWRADPDNQRVLDRVHELWGELSFLNERRQAAKLKKANARPRWPIYAVASLLIACAGLVYVGQWRPSASLQTAIGQQKTEPLPDGSVITLNVVSHVTYNISDTQRVVKIEKGEAAFTVRSDADRPFVVQVGAYEIRALGTVFNVRQRDGTIDVAVSEGRIQVCSATSGDILATLEAGQLLRLGSAPEEHAVAHISPIPTAQVAEWRTRIVTYEDARIDQVVADLNRFFEQPILVDDAALASRHVTLRLQVDDRDRAVRMLAGILGLSLVDTQRGTLLTAPH